MVAGSADEGPVPRQMTQMTTTLPPCEGHGKSKADCYPHPRWFVQEAARSVLRLQRDGALPAGADDVVVTKTVGEAVIAAWRSVCPEHASS